MAGLKSGLSLGNTQRVERSAVEIMEADSRIGIAEIDRFTVEYNPTGGEKGTGAVERRANVTSEPAVELVVNEGKGFGAQVVAVSDVPDTLDALQEIINSGFERPEGDTDNWRPPGDVIRATWRMVHPRVFVNEGGKKVPKPDTSRPKDWVSFQTRGGRGAKPAVIHKSELPQLIAFLAAAPEIAEANETALWADYNAIKNAEAEALRKAAIEAALANGQEIPADPTVEDPSNENEELNEENEE